MALIVESNYNSSKDRFEISVNGERLDTHYSSRQWAIYHDTMIIKVDKWDQNPAELRFLRNIESNFPELSKHFPRIIDSGVGIGKTGEKFTWILEEKFEFLPIEEVTYSHVSELRRLRNQFGILDLSIEKEYLTNCGVTREGIPVIFDIGITEENEQRRHRGMAA